MKPKKAIVLKDVNTKLSIPTDGIIFNPPLDQQESKQYYQDRIKLLQDKLIRLQKLEAQMGYLQEFRKLLSGYCINNNIQKTVIQCTVTRRKEDCTFKECNELKKWKKLLSF
jgi:hypothetical protein